MSNHEEIKILTEIKKTLEANNEVLRDIKATLQNDRSMMWKILALTIGGAFAIVGVKLAFP